jgi:hypothetical protein
MAMTGEACSKETKSSDQINASKTRNTGSNTESSPEEIARQHAEAVLIVKNGIQYSEPEWEGEIPLCYKQQPVGLNTSAELPCVSTSSLSPTTGDETELPPSLTNNHQTAPPIPCWSTRGHATVTALQDLIRHGYSQTYRLDATKVIDSANNAAAPINYWDPAMAATYNVPIRRKSHDAWGIPKIVLLFCDDFCQDRFELPWWWQTKQETDVVATDQTTITQTGFAEAIQPILDVLRVPPERVVRLLLASLPPGATIPVHFDTGEWVKYTHRIHVPVLVSNVSRILFRCGPTLDNMASISCTPGHVFEINNQALHAVSNCDNDSRVHLILDYVDKDFVQCRNHLTGNYRERIRLQPGEILMQTRRSIDRLACKGQRPAPSFMILGAQKAGTTFLFEAIMQHPLAIKPKDGRRETHCLDWRWNDKATTVETQRKWCRQFYYWQELELHPSCLTGDSTPSYLLDSRRVIPRLQAVFPWRLVFFVMCRDPVARVESHYAMVTSKQGTPAQLKARGSEWRSLSVDQVIWHDFLKLQKCGLLPYWTSAPERNGSSTNTVEFWKSAVFDARVFDSFSDSPEEDAAWIRYLQLHVPVNTGSYGLLSRGLYALQLRPWFQSFDPSSFLVLKLEAMTANADCLSSTTRQVWNHLSLPPIDLAEDASSPKNSREYDRDALLTEDTRDFLHRFYQPHNKRLLRLLRESRREQFCGNDALWAQHWSSCWEPN